MATYSPFAKPLYIMLKPVGSICNLACDYCYYLEKGDLYKQVAKHQMDDSLLEKFVKEYIESQTTPYINFTWHGGETLMRDLSFYKKALKLQKIYGRGRVIENAIQTNGTLINDEWCRFFKDNNWLVGISIDGPERFHNAYRKNRVGKDSFSRVMRGVNLLKKHGVEWNGMGVVNNLNGDYPLEFYNFFKEIECQYIQFTPIVERRIKPKKEGDLEADIINGSLMEKVKKGTLASLQVINDDADLESFSVSPIQWGNFLCALFDEWVKEDVGRYFIQIFDSALANWVGEQPGVCSYAKNCGHAGVMEFNGDVYSCDHFVFPEYKLGNIYEKSLIEMMYSDRQQKFGLDKSRLLPEKCLNCKWLFACNGECPKNRFSYTSDGEPFLNYLCRGYYKFYSHIAPYMDYMKNELVNGRPPANVMDVVSDIKNEFGNLD